MGISVNKGVAPGLEAGLHTQLTALDVNQKLVQIAGDNIANAQNPDYRTTEISVISRYVGGEGIGVEASEKRRIADETSIEGVRKQTLIAANLESLEKYYHKIQQHFGKPGENNSVVRDFVELKKAFAQASAEGKFTETTNIIDKANTLVNKVKALTNHTQAVRKQADREIGESTKKVTAILEQIQSENTYLSKNPDPSHLDKRDALLKELSQYMDFSLSTKENNQIELHTKNTNRILLLGEAQPINYTATNNVNANTVFGAITIGTDPADITGDITSGKIGALIQMRDSIAPGLQTTVDAEVAALRDTLNAISNEGTAVGPAAAGNETGVPNTLTGTRQLVPANAFTGTGVVRVAVIDNANGQVVSFQDMNLAAPGTLQAVRDTLNGYANMSANFTATGELQLSADNANHGIALVTPDAPAVPGTETGTGKGFSDYMGFNDIFVTGATHEGAPAGLSSALEVRSSLKTTPTLLPTGRLKSGALLVGDKGVNENTFKPITDMALAMDARIDTMNKMIESSSNEASTIFESAKRENQTLNLVEHNERDHSGVNIEKQMMDMMITNRNNAASNKVIEMINSMFRMLFSIKVGG